MRNPRVLMLSDVYFPRVNGVSTSIQTFRRDLEAEVAAASSSRRSIPRNATTSRASCACARAIFRSTRRTCLVVAGALDHAVRSLGPGFDLVHIHTPFVAHTVGLRVARRLGIPVVETYHTFFEQYFHHYLPWAPRALLRGLAARSPGGNAMRSTPSSRLRRRWRTCCTATACGPRRR